MRKFTCLALAIVCLAAAAQAQITRGSVFLGGSVYGSSNTTTNDAVPDDRTKTSTLGIMPQFGLAIKDNTIIGISLRYNRQGFERTFPGVNANSESTINSYGGDVFYRRYFSLGKRFYLFGEGSFGYTYGDYKSSQVTTNPAFGGYNQSSVVLAVTPGISYQASRKLFLETTLNSLFYASYGRYKSYISGPSSQLDLATTETFGIGANTNAFSTLAIGLRWILPHKTT